MAYKNNTGEGIPTDGTAISSSNQGSSGDVLTPVKTGAATIVGTATAGEVILQSKSYKCSNASGEAAYLMWTEGTAGVQSSMQFGARCYYRFSAAPSVNTALLVFQGNNTTGNGQLASITLRPDGRFYLASGAAGAPAIYTSPTGTPFTFPGIFALDMAIDCGTSITTGRAKFDVYGSAGATTPFITMAEMTGQDFWRGGFGIQSVRFGKFGGEAQALTIELDGMRRSDSYELMGNFTVPVDAPPVVTPPAAQRRVSGATASFTMTATDPDGDPVTAATWTNTSRPAGASAPTLTMSGSPSGITATTNALTVPGIFTFTPSATAGGLSTVGAVHTEYVSAADGSCQPRAKRAGSTWSGVVGDVQDMSTTNYNETPAAPVTASVVYDMNPINDGDIQTVTITSELSPVGGAACTMQIDCLTGAGDTVFATRTVSLADAWQSFVLGGTTNGGTTPPIVGVTAFTSGEKAAFTDHSLWAIRLIANQT